MPGWDTWINCILNKYMGISSVCWICGWDLKVTSLENTNGDAWLPLECWGGLWAHSPFAGWYTTWRQELGGHGKAISQQISPLGPFKWSWVLWLWTSSFCQSHFQMALDVALYLAFERYFIYIFSMNLGPNLSNFGGLCIITYHFTNNRPFLQRIHLFKKLVMSWNALRRDLFCKFKGTCLRLVRAEICQLQDSRARGLCPRHTHVSMKLLSWFLLSPFSTAPLSVVSTLKQAIPTLGMLELCSVPHSYAFCRTTPSAPMSTRGRLAYFTIKVLEVNPTVLKYSAPEAVHGNLDTTIKKMEKAWSAGQERQTSMLKGNGRFDFHIYFLIYENKTLVSFI